MYIVSSLSTNQTDNTIKLLPDIQCHYAGVSYTFGLSTVYTQYYAI